MTTDNPKTTALAVRTTVSMAAYEPKDFPQAMQMAATLGKAAGLSAEVAYLKMAAGADYGIPAVTALRLIDIIDGPNGTKQPAPRAQLMVALCLRAPEVIEYLERVSSDATQATWRGKRAGRPEQVVTYTVKDAERAKLIKSGGAWEKDPESQCNARASARLVRLIAPDVAGGMVAYEERDSVEASPAPVQPLPQSTPGAPAQDFNPQTGEVHDRAVDTDFTDEPVQPDPNTGRVCILLAQVSDDAALAAARDEIKRTWPPKAGEKKPAAPSDVWAVYEEAKLRVEAIKKEGGA